MEKDELLKILDERDQQFRAKWESTRGWRHDRWVSITADPQAAFVCAVVGAIAAKFGPIAWIWFFS